MNDLIIIPTYNEKENLGPLLEAIYEIRPDIHVLVVDDNSPDGTGQLVAEWAEAPQYEGRLFLLRRAGKLGLGTAYIAGFRWALARSYRRIFEMDADFSHNPNDLPKLYEACRNADMSIGSRYKNGVNVVNWPMGRVLMSYFASKYVRVITGMPIHDTTAGFKCYRRKVLETIDLDNIHFRGYAFQIEMKFTAYKCGFKIVEVPVIFVNRVKGTSKMNSSIFGEAVFGVIRLKLFSLFHHFPKV